MEPTMGLGRLLLRVTIGGTFFVHGTQKLFGWFGGYGPDGPGALSLDSALGLERSGPGWMLAALGAGAAGSAMAIEMGRRQPAAPASTEPAEAAAAAEEPPAPEAGAT